MREEFLIYLEGETTYITSGGTIKKYSFNDFLENPPKGKGILLINDEKFQIKRLNLPKHQKINLYQTMLYETLELTQMKKKELIFKWRFLGNDEKESFYLLFVLPKLNIFSFWEKLKKQKFEIKDVFCTLDLLVKIGEKYSESEGDCFIFFNNNIVYFLAFKDKIFLFHRKVELKNVEVDVSWQELVLELKRSLFYAKQKYKIIPEKLKILMPPSWFTPKLSETLAEELAIVKTEVIEFKKFSKDVPFLDIFMSNLDIISSLISFLPPEVLQEKKLKKVSILSVFVLSICFLGIIQNLFYHWSNYQYQTNIYFDVSRQLNKLEQKIKKQGEKLNYLKCLQNQANEIKNFLEKRSFVQIYLTTIPYILPKEIHLEKLSFIPEETGYVLILSGKVDTKEIPKRGIIFQSFLENIKKMPFLTNITLNTIKLFTEGEFHLTAYLKKIKYED